IIIGVIFVATSIFQAYQKKQTNKYATMLADLLYKQKFREFYQLLEDKKVKRSVPPFNIDFMKLNAAVMQKDPGKIKEALERFEHVRLNNKQKQAVYINAFNYFVYQDDKKQAKYCYEKLQGLSFPERPEIERIYNTFIEEKADYLDEVLEDYNDAEGDEKIGYLPMLIQIYQNLGDKQKAKEYGDILKDYLKEK
ncbi:MAG: hypothetical protein II712_01000, partial [Erysipelotrichaceae bacterium]|nr:hypothetical protein [Erysipelotrichaceae bacterium]